MLVEALPPVGVSQRPTVLKVIEGYRPRLAVMTLAALLGGLAEATFLFLCTRVAFALSDEETGVDLVVGGTRTVNEAIGIAFVLVVLRVGLAAIASAISARVTSSRVALTRLEMSEAFLRAAWPVQQRQREGSLQELVSSFAMQTSNVMTGVSQGLVAGANLAALIGLAVVSDPVGAIVIVVAGLVFGSALRPLRAAVRRRATAASESSLHLGTVISNISSLGMEVNVFHVQDPALAYIGDAIETNRERQRGVLVSRGLATPAYLGLAYLALLGALGAVQAVDAAEPVALGTSLLLMLRSLSYGQALQQSYIAIAGSVPSIEEVQRQLAELRSGHAREGTAVPDGVGVLTATGVTYAYREGEPVLHDLTFSIGPHELVGIVGPSGGGKSTLVQLLLGLREPVRGELRIDGQDLRNVSRERWARLVTFVPQSPRLLHGTVADNIRFFRDVSVERIEHAARQAHVHDEIVAHPDGYRRRIDEDHLSGGQQQRICIARALVESPEVLILDEPTSALDVSSEALIRSTLESLRGQMTVVVIAHRLSTVERCDRIMVIEQGRIMDFDAPEVLESASGYFRDSLRAAGLR